MKLAKVLELPGNIIIWCDKRNWVLEWGGKNNRWFYPALDDLCDDFFEIRLKIEASRARKIKHDIRDLSLAVQAARVAARQDIEQLKEAVTSKDRESRLKDLDGDEQ